jgi:ATP adenylyltransferase/5',5'''-P-1,P-4-tetraphosphate phosphorylase II
MEDFAMGALTGTVPFELTCDDEFVVVVPPSDDETRVRIKVYPAEWAGAVLARASNMALTRQLPNGAMLVIELTTTIPGPS